MTQNSQTTYEISNEGNLPDKLTSIRNMALSYNLLMRGYALNPSNGNYDIQGSAMMGKQFINQTTNILLSFCEYCNLITTKDDEKYIVEFRDAFYRVNAMLCNDRTRTKETYRAVIKIFKDRMSGIGDIIVGSRKLTSKIFENEKFLDGTSMGEI